MLMIPFDLGILLVSFSCLDVTKYHWRSVSKPNQCNVDTQGFVGKALGVAGVCIQEERQAPWRVGMPTWFNSYISNFEYNSKSLHSVFQSSHQIKLLVSMLFLYTIHSGEWHSNAINNKDCGGKWTTINVLSKLRIHFYFLMNYKLEKCRGEKL